MKAIDVANFFIDLYSGALGNDLTNLKLNKLLYYSQAIHLAMYDKPLFEDDIVAWQYGPVVKDVYVSFAPNQGNVISDSLSPDYRDEMTPGEINFLLDIGKNYGDISTRVLVDMTHVKGGPWFQCYNGLPKTVIPQDLIRDYTKEHELKHFSRTKIDVSKIPALGRRNADGLLILPASEDCEEDNYWDDYYRELSACKE